jgi:hypothetical protein
MPAYYNEFDPSGAAWLRGAGNAINLAQATGFIEAAAA